MQLVSDQLSESRQARQGAGSLPSAKRIVAFSQKKAVTRKPEPYKGSEAQSKGEQGWTLDKEKRQHKIANNWKD